ncbi:MAG: L-type lectin-domain containing protein [Planctomycetota bacterium]
MRILCALLGLVLLAPLVAGQCEGDAGYTLLTIPPEVEYGALVSFELDTPTPATAFWFFSLGEGPFDTPFGRLCIDFPPSFSLAVPVSNAGATYEVLLPCDSGIAGLVVYHQFIAFSTVDPGEVGISNQSQMTVLNCSAYCAAYPDFSDPAGIKLNKDAAIVGNALRLAANSGNQGGTAFYDTRATITPDTSFTTRFQFRIHGSGDGADGMTFMVQGNDSSIVGGLGTGLGYSGITHSIAVEIDNYTGTGDPNANHIGVLRDGDVTLHYATYTPDFDLEDENSHTIWVEYDGPSDTLRVYLSNAPTFSRPPTPVITVTSFDLYDIVGPSGYLGLSAATGGAYNNHDVENWEFRMGEF